MMWLLLGILLITLAGVAGLFWRHDADGGDRLACAMTIAGCVCGTIAVASVLISGHDLNLSLPWHSVGGELALHLDPLAAIFLLPLFLVVSAGALYGLDYWPQRQHPGNAAKFRLFYGIISAAMIVLICAANGLLFLIGWELMAVAGFFLITTEDHKPEVRRAGYVYLIATHCGTLALFGVFALLDHSSGGLGFPAPHSLPATGNGLIFVLALFGFGMKAGLMPLHIWLPGAHAAAPSHASALLSGIMIKTGIYGLIRLTSLFAEIPAWWGWSVLLLGAISGVMGVVLALAQHDIKRLLAYHSVENIGIIALGLGLALLGRSYQLPQLVAFGLAGALLHVINHGLFKSLLFLSAGAVIQAVGSRQIDQFGGLLKRQPWTATLFLGGAVAICALPPLNGFISEWLIYLAAFQPLQQPGSSLAAAVLTAPVLALIGGLALACFVKVFSVTFLGQARSAAVAQAGEASRTMRTAMLVLLAACIWIGLLPTTVLPQLGRAVRCWTGSAAAADLTSAVTPLGWLSVLGWLLLAALAAGGLWLQRRQRHAPNNVATWGCGFRFSTARMQYTASSFADFLVQLFDFGLWSERHGGKSRHLFAPPAHFASHTPDAILDRLLWPGFQSGAWLCRRLRASMQNGLMASYLLYVALTIIALLSFFIL